jgi:hypothetical protein
MFLSNRIIVGAGTVAAPSYSFFNDLSMGLYDPSSNVLGFVTSGVERMRILANGRVGIGTTTPGYLLDVSSGTTSEGIRVTAPNASLEMSNPGSGSVFVFNNGSNQGFYAGNATPFVIQRGGSINVRVLSNGSVGIGTTDPSEILHVVGNQNLSGELTFSPNAAGQKITMYNSGGGKLGFGVFSSEFRNSTDNSGTAITWGYYTGATFTERMRLVTSSGNVGIGTSAPRAGLGSSVALDVCGCIYGRLPVTVFDTSGLLDLSTNFTTYANSYIYLTNTAFSSVRLPTAVATTLGGTFFQLKNSTPAFLSVTLNATLGLVSPVSIAPSNAITLVVSPSVANRLLLF